MKKFSLSFAVVAAAIAASAMEIESLDGLWSFSFHENAALRDIAPDAPAPEKMPVPGCFDLSPDYYMKRGTALYRRTFEIDGEIADAFLVVKGMGVRMRAWIDGREIGRSKLAYSTVELPVGRLAPGVHTLSIALDNRIFYRNDELFMPFYDFLASGGFYHGVDLKIQRLPVELDRVFVRTRDYESGLVELCLEFKGAKNPLSIEADVSFDGASPVKVLFENGRAKLNVPGFKLWTPETPELHRVKVSVEGKGEQEARFGIRQFKCAKGRFFLNGKSVFLKGVNRHDADAQNGYATTMQSMWRDIKLMKSLGCNFVRTAHYTPSEDFLSLCDEMGILVWQECLGWGNLPWELGSKSFRDLQIEQARLMARNSINHPSVVIDAFLNEFVSSSKEGREMAGMLVDALRAEDTGHAITYAASCNATDISNDKTDFIAFNLYPSWHQNQGTATTSESMKKTVTSRFAEVTKIFRDRHGPDKPIMIGETGCYSIYGSHDPAGAQWSEEFQAEYLGNSVSFAFDNPDIQGVAVWQFSDARTYFRGGADVRTKPLGLNMAGLFDIHRREKLSARKIREIYTTRNK